MTKFGIVTLLAGGLIAAIVVLSAPAAAAPSGPGNAQDTITELEREGYRVIVNRFGTTPLDRASVLAIRPGHTYSRTDSGLPGARDDVVTTVLGRTVYVDVM